MSQIRRIGSFAKVRRGASPRPISDSKYFGGTVGWVRIVDVTKHNYKYLRITEQYLSEFGQSKSVTVRKGDLIMSICATVGKPIIVDMTACIHDGFVQLYDLDGVDTEYLFYQLQFNESKFERSGQPGTQVNLNTNIVENKQIWLPDNLDEQLKIAKIISIIDRAIAKTEALIEKYQQIKAGLMHDLFTRGIGTDGKLRSPCEEAPELYQESAIGWIPKEWEAIRVKDILEDSGSHLQTGPFGSQLHAREYTFEGVPFVMPQNINNGKIDENEIARIMETRAQSLHRHRLKIGDIIIARRGELSRAASISSIEQGWVCGSGCFVLRLRGNNLDSRFFSYMYRNEIVQRQVVGLAVGSTMPSLNNEIMGKLVFPYMSKTEQSAMADKVDLVEVKITMLNSELVKLLKQKSGLMHDLLTGKVSVNVDSAP